MAVSPDPQTTTALAPEPPARKPAPPLLGVRHWIIYGTGVLVILLLVYGATRAFRQGIDAYQFSRPRYAAERAVKALAQGNKEEARKEIQALMQDVPIKIEGGLLGRPVDEVWEGRVQRNRVSILKHLTGQLLAAGMTAEAEDVAWKMMLEFHVSSRPLEFVDLWEWMVWVKAARQDWGAAFEACRILGAHGAQHLREPGQIEPDPIKVAPAAFPGLNEALPPTLQPILADGYQSTVGAEYYENAQRLLKQREAIKQPTVRQKIDDLILEYLVKGGQPAQAHAFFGKVWGGDLGVMDKFWREWPDPQSVNLLDRDPNLMGMMWHDRPASATLTLGGFLDSFKNGDPRVKVVDFSRLMAFQLGYFNKDNKLTPFGDQMVLGQSIAATMPVQVTRTVHRVYIAYQSSGALGIYPILLVRVDKGEWTPLYCDSEQPDLVYFDTKLDGPATHTFDFVYLNDGAFSWPPQSLKEDRNLSLLRMALVQVPPGQKPAPKQAAEKTARDQAVKPEGKPAANPTAEKMPVAPQAKPTTQTQTKAPDQAVGKLVIKPVQAEAKPAQRQTSQSQAQAKPALGQTTQTKTQ